MNSLVVGYWSGLGPLCSLVGFDRALRTPSLSRTPLWILNKSMPSDWTLEPLANENHFSEISILPLSPPVCLFLAGCSVSLSHTFRSHFAHLCPLPTGQCTFTHTYYCFLFTTVFFLFLFFLFCFFIFPK